MATFPKKSGIVNLANIDLANTLDFHIAYTNWLKILQDYSNDVATYYVYNFTKHTADPITSQANLFLTLNFDTLNLTSDERGTIDAKVLEETVTGYRLAKLDTLLAPTEVWIRSDDGLPERRTDVGTASAYHAIDLSTGDDRWYTFTENLDKLVKDNLKNVVDGYGTGSMGFEFQYYWYEKFHTAHSKVKEEYDSIIAESDIPQEDNFFSSLSDTIGSIARVAEMVDPSMIPISLDRNFDVFETPVTTLPLNIDDKLTLKGKEFDGELTRKVNTLFRINIKEVIESLGAPDIAHQQNLMSDYLHWKRMVSMTESLNGTIAQTLGKGYALLFYIRNAQNKQQTVSPVISAVVEDSIVRVDMLKNKIQSINKDIGNDILKSRASNSDDLS